MTKDAMKAAELAVKYELKPNVYYPEGSDPYRQRQDEVLRIIDEWPEKGYPPSEMFMPQKYRFIKAKWDDFVGEGFQGFSMDPPCPDCWYDVIDEFLDYVKKECSDFKISQIKIKLGGLKIYLTGINDEIRNEIQELEQVLYDERLKTN